MRNDDLTMDSEAIINELSTTIGQAGAVVEVPHELARACHVEREVIKNWFGRDLVVRALAMVAQAGERTETLTVYVPINWVHHLWEDHAPQWAKRRWPAKMRTVQREVRVYAAVCPHTRHIPEADGENRHLRFLFSGDYRRDQEVMSATSGLLSLIDAMYGQAVNPAWCRGPVFRVGLESFASLCSKAGRDDLAARAHEIVAMRFEQ